MQDHVLDSEAPASEAENADDGVTHRATTDTVPSSSAGPRWDLPKMRVFFEGEASRLLAGRIACPVLLVHARGDDVVPFSHSLLLTEHLTTETTLLALPGGSHTTAQHDPRVHSFTVRWLGDAIKELTASGRPGRTQWSGG